MNTNTGKRSFARIIRSLHRDIGFLLVGMTLLYCASGIIMIYRDQGFLKFEEHVETTVAPGLVAEELAPALKLRRLEIDRQDGDMLYFNNGQYNASTGEVSYTVEKFPLIIEKINSLHLSPSSSTIHYFGVTYGALLFFLAASSLFMYRIGTKQSRRGIIIASAGAISAFLIVAL